MAKIIKIVHVSRVREKLKKCSYQTDHLFIAANVKSNLALTSLMQKDIYSFSFMPNTKSAIRRAKRTKLQASVNKIRKSKYRLAIKKMSNYINAGKTKEAREFLPKFHSQLMKVAKTGVINKKTASRKISRIEKKIQKLKK